MLDEGPQRELNVAKQYQSWDLGDYLMPNRSTEFLRFYS